MKAERERWATSPPMKLHGKNILKCISNNVVKDGPLRSSECIAMLS